MFFISFQQPFENVFSFKSFPSALAEPQCHSLINHFKGAFHIYFLCTRQLRGFHFIKSCFFSLRNIAVLSPCKGITMNEWMEGITRQRKAM